MEKKVLIIYQKIKRAHFSCLIGHFTQHHRSVAISIEDPDFATTCSELIKTDQVEAVILCNWFVYRSKYMLGLVEQLEERRIPIVTYSYDFIPETWDHYQKVRPKNMGMAFASRSAQEMWQRFVEQDMPTTYVEGIGPFLNKGESFEAFSVEDIVDNLAVYVPVNLHWQNFEFRDVQSFIAHMPSDIRSVVDNAIGHTKHNTSSFPHQVVPDLVFEAGLESIGNRGILGLIRAVTTHNQLWRRRKVLEKLSEHDCVTINPVHLDKDSEAFLADGKAKLITGVDKNVTRTLVQNATSVLSFTWAPDFIHDRIDTSLALGSRALAEDLEAHSSERIPEQDRILKFDYSDGSLEEALERARALHADRGSDQRLPSVYRSPDYSRISELFKVLRCVLA